MNYGITCKYYILTITIKFILYNYHKILYKINIYMVLFSNYKNILENLDKNFYFKFFILFIAYLVTTHLFSELHTEYFKPIIDQQDYIYIRIQNNFWFKFLWTVIIIIISSYVYTTIIKPYIV